MKTCYFEERKKSAKLFHKNNQQCTHYKNGILNKYEVTLNELFPNYCYTKQNWADEKAERGEKEFHVHAIR